MNSDTEAKKPVKSQHAEREERILEFWDKDDSFKKSVDKEAPKGDFTFYDGPPFATGMPHYGHILAGTMKDVIPRYKSMQGYRVRRRWGWDCHGLPVENLLEKELGLQSKKDIVSYGLGKFNAAARNIVLRYADEWRKIIPRLGRWVDMKDDYRTMDSSYTESVWWAFKQLYGKGLVYEDFKSMSLCPHCETTLSNFEVAQGYKDITDISVFVKFELVGEPKAYLIAWTTTPWTLPGNFALAIGPNIEYIRVKMADTGETYIIAKDRLTAVLKDKKYESVGTVKGSELAGKSYKPIFGYYSHDISLKNRNNGWKVYAADFVTTTDGTGIVHIAPAFGSDDYELMKKHDLPFVQHVAVDGTFKPEVKDFAGRKVKPRDSDQDKNAHQSADIEVIKWLAHNGFLFEKEKIVHSYPHCWRCETPLLNYATSSWFVRVSSFKDKLVKENEKVKWVPSAVGENRFGNWLEGARDWAISRSRFWGAPIPVWRDEKGKHHVIGSVADLKKYSRPRNTYYVIRHGEADNNVLGVLSGVPDAPHHLTAKGREQVAKSAERLKGVKFDLAFVSPFVRTHETYAILKDKLGLKHVTMRTDDRLRELGTGSWNGRKISEYYEHFNNASRFDSHPDGVENYGEIRKRMGDFIYDIDSKHEGKTILIVTHETPAFLLMTAVAGKTKEEAIAERIAGAFIKNAEVHKLDFSPLPHNEDYELDLHRPFIDDIKLTDPSGSKLERVPDVFDCWFESGSMPYAEAHYPFEAGEGVEEGGEFNPGRGLIDKLFGRSSGYPADFIAEGLDQTRGWFYSMLVLGTALFGRSPYRNVIVNGLVLAEDGQKMSKSKKNYPDLEIIVEKYGADALRHYLMSSQAVRAEDLRFSEKGVDEVVKKVINRLLNVVSFYEMYATGDLRAQDKAIKPGSVGILDRWIISRLNELISAVTDGLESYEIDRAARPIEDFIDDLSTWYLRRSRDRFKGEDESDKAAALSVTRFVLAECAKVIAPFMPFLAEDIHQRIFKGDANTPSVHLQKWPISEPIDTKLLADMRTARNIASKGLEARMKAGINVRQPLSKLSVSSSFGALADAYLGLIRDEVNVKEVVLGAASQTDVDLDTALTPELKEEGEVRELLRRIQDLRKERGLKVGDKAVLTVTSDLKDLATKNEKAIKDATSLSAIEFGDAFGLKSL
jgi:isoleucyl-tRNA synthetase